MRLVTDTSILVGELLRVAGRERMADARLELFIPQQMAGEFAVELPRRIAAFAQRRGVPSAAADQLMADSLSAVEANVVVVAEAVYASMEEEALARCERDPRDWPVVACALVLSAGIWTNDNDFLGAGVPTWTTATLSAWLARHPG